MVNRNPEDLECLIRRLVVAGGNALFSSLENLADLLEDYERAPRGQSTFLSPEDYEALLQHQGGVCAICGRKPKERLVIDHSHSSGLVRGLLCNRCNLGLGLFEDDQKRLLAAIQYLKTQKLLPPLLNDP